MGGQMIVSGGNALRLYAGMTAEMERCVMHVGAGALCAGRDVVYVACDPADVIFKMSFPALTPMACFAGGPGICRLLLSRDGKRLYALCRDADSVLMLDAESGAPLVLCRVGIAPNAMEMDDTGTVIAVAGGICEEVILLDAQNLCILKRMNTRGIVQDTLIANGKLYALSMGDSMDAMLTAFYHESVQRRRLGGAPGALAPVSGGVAAATQGRLYIVSGDGLRIHRLFTAPGRAARLAAAHGGMAMLDMWNDCLYIKTQARMPWLRAAKTARDMVWMKM